VAVADGFFAGAGLVDGFEGQGNFNEFFAGHGWGHLITAISLALMMKRVKHA
jgi:hypothetical protein